MKHVSKNLILYFALIFVAIHLIFGFWRFPEKIISSDVIDYYSYLPATFIYKDLTLKFKEENPEKFQNKIYGFKLENGNYAIKMTMGLAILFTPFFLLAHLLALISPFAADGYSTPYAIALLVAGLFYFLAGVYFLKKLLLKFFDLKTTLITIILLTFATNFSYYITREAAMSHSFSFFLFSVFLYLCNKWYENPKIRTSILLGLVVGLIVLVRPTNMIVVLIFLFWNYSNNDFLNSRINLLVKNYKSILIIKFLAILVLLPQFAYWKFVTGNILHYSYIGESFFFLDPEFLNVLFGFRKGLFIYTPIIFFAFAGFYFLYKRHKNMFYPLVIFSFVNLYIISSWWCWWYGGSLGHRAFIESYAMLSFPLAALIAFCIERTKGLRVFFYIIMFVLVFHAFFQKVKYLNNAIHWDSMTRLAYFETFEKLKPTTKFYELLVTPDYENALKNMPERIIPFIPEEVIIPIFQNYDVQVIDYQSFETLNEQQTNEIKSFVTNRVSRSFESSLNLSAEQVFRPALETQVTNYSIKDAKAIMAEVYLNPKNNVINDSIGLVISFEHNSEMLKYELKTFDISNFQPNEWTLLFSAVEVPENLPENSVLKVYLWNINGKFEGYVDDFRVILINPKR